MKRLESVVVVKYYYNIKPTFTVNMVSLTEQKSLGFQLQAFTVLASAVAIETQKGKVALSQTKQQSSNRFHLNWCLAWLSYECNSYHRQYLNSLYITFIIVFLTHATIIMNIIQPHQHFGLHHCRHYNPISVKYKSFPISIKSKTRVKKYVDDRKSHLCIRASEGDEKQQFLNSITDRKRDYSTSKDLFIALADPTLSPMTT